LFHGLGPLACSDSELTSETMKRSKCFGRTPWTGNRPIAKPLPTQDSTAHILMAPVGFETKIPVFSW